jgi:hypothetical protein
LRDAVARQVPGHDFGKVVAVVVEEVVAVPGEPVGADATKEFLRNKKMFLKQVKMKLTI